MQPQINSRYKSYEMISNPVFSLAGSLSNSAVEGAAAKETIHRNFRDLAIAKGSEEEQLAVFRQVRDEIKEWIEMNFK